MNITLYNTPSAVNTATKDITAAVSGSITVTPYGQIDVKNPVFILDYNAAYLPANYAKVQLTEGTSTMGVNTFYYFATVSTDNGGQLIVRCRRDPLFSFINQIKERPATVIRYQRKKDGKTGATKVVDTKFPIIPNKEDLQYTIATAPALNNADEISGVPVRNYALIVMNGGVSI